jgi:hypothetical protein
MASKSSFFSLTGGQNTFLPTQITVGGTYSASGPGLYWVNRGVGLALTFNLPSTALVSPFAVAVYVKDIKGDAGGFPITIVDPNGYPIDGQLSLTLNTPYAAATLVWSGAGWSQVA